jgi:ankyrin repeat protein
LKLPPRKGSPKLGRFTWPVRTVATWFLSPINHRIPPVQGNSNALVKLVLDMGVDVNHRDKRQRTALHHAVAGRKPESIAIAMKRLQVKIEACNDPSSVRSIVAQYNAKSTITRYDSQIILTLLQAGADVDLVDACGLSALMYAALTGNLIGVTVILSRKPRIDGQDKDGYTTLIMAAGLGHAEIAKALVNAGANLDVQDKEGGTALMCAAGNGHTEIAKALVSAGANLNVK